MALITSGRAGRGVRGGLRGAREEDAAGEHGRAAEARAGGGDNAVGETAILLHPPLHLVDVSIRVGRGCQQNDSLADG